VALLTRFSTPSPFGRQAPAWLERGCSLFEPHPPHLGCRCSE
jgi:hypothetical protein